MTRPWPRCVMLVLLASPAFAIDGAGRAGVRAGAWLGRAVETSDVSLTGPAAQATVWGGIGAPALQVGTGIDLGAAPLTVRSGDARYGLRPSLLFGFLVQAEVHPPGPVHLVGLARAAPLLRLRGSEHRSVRESYSNLGWGVGLGLDLPRGQARGAWGLSAVLQRHDLASGGPRFAVWAPSVSVTMRWFDEL